MKYVHDTLYTHRDYLTSLPEASRLALERSQLLLPVDYLWNIFKIDLQNNVSFSYYPLFDELPHPPLHHWLFVNHDQTAHVIRFESRLNPSILHRKELFVDTTHPRYHEYAYLTHQEQEAGLFDSAHLSRIGRQKFWEQLLDNKDLELTGHRLRRKEY